MRNVVGGWLAKWRWVALASHPFHSMPLGSVPMVLSPSILVIMSLVPMRKLETSSHFYYIAMADEVGDYLNYSHHGMIATFTIHII